MEACSGAINKDLLNNFNKDCVGKSNCDIEIKSHLNLGFSGNAKCVAKFSKFYMQYQCKMGPKEKRETQEFAVKLVAVFLAAAALFYVAIDYNQNLGEILFKQWDMNTVTVADYTV